MDFICFKIPYEYRPCLDLKLKKITPRTRPQIRLYGVKNTACIYVFAFSVCVYLGYLLLPGFSLFGINSLGIIKFGIFRLA